MSDPVEVKFDQMIEALAQVGLDSDLITAQTLNDLVLRIIKLESCK